MGISITKIQEPQTQSLTTEKTQVIERQQSDLVKSPDNDTFEKENVTKSPKKKFTLKKILLGISIATLLLYGSIVLKHKLTKPTLAEVQECFRKIFSEDLTNEQIGDLINKYKEICKNKDPEKFTKEIIEQLKKDYKLDNINTKLKITNKKEVFEQNDKIIQELGFATPIGDIQIYIDKSQSKFDPMIQKQRFNTSFHELKHLKQFLMAYRTDPQEFAKSAYYNNKQKNIDNFKKDISDHAKKLHTGDQKSCERIAKESHCSITEVIDFYKNKSIEDIEKIYYKNLNIETPEKLDEYLIKNIKKSLDDTYGKYTLFDKDSKEFKEGKKYIKGYLEYPDPKENYEKYRNNILEQEAFANGDLADKIHKYLTMGSIWKL